MLGSLVRPLWLLPLIALALAGLACQKDVEAKFRDVERDPFTVAPGQLVDYVVPIGREMIRVPRDLNNVTLYVQWNIPSGDTVSVYVLTSANMDKYAAHEPFTAIRESHGVQNVDFWIHDMWEGDYHLVVENHNASPVNFTNVSIYILYFGYKD
jgi:hypothetical protein